MEPLSILRGLDDVVELPVYIFSGQHGYICDKVWRSSLGIPMRTRYRLRARSCTCLGHLKVGDCKHQKILTGRSWTLRMVPRSYAEEAFIRVGVTLFNRDEECVRKIMLSLFSDMPDPVKEIALIGSSSEDPYLIAWVVKFPGSYELAFSITSKNFPTTI